MSTHDRRRHPPYRMERRGYDQLVLPEATKDFVKALVHECRTDSKLVQDFVATKGDGVVLALYGEPGTGKTLTAEAVAEELRRPMMVIAVSNLGSEIRHVEIELESLLRTAERWDSIVLLDEADIFLEKRGRDHYRNAMVAVFLKMLESHNSPLFMTTNRVFEFDSAIRSRVNVAIEYKTLDRQARTQVWRQFLARVEHELAEDEISKDLALFRLNGRYHAQTPLWCTRLTLVEISRTWFVRRSVWQGRRGRS
jgi:SpoVK/Ycf46/Vps4 family AAA+-type ATPase